MKMVRDPRRTGPRFLAGPNLAKIGGEISTYECIKISKFEKLIIFSVKF